MMALAKRLAPPAVVLVCLGGGWTPLGAQQPAGEPAAEGGGVLTPLPDLEDIDEIFEAEEEILAGAGDTYDPGDRRDPFKSLLVVTDQPALEGPRPEGIPGLLIDEIVLSGIYRTKNGYIAQVQAADRQKSYLLKVGDQLFDGDVIAINRNEVVFRQNVQDPTALKPFREVVRALNPP
jgi:hypothetical protein